jgi:hypothetical protein
LETVDQIFSLAQPETKILCIVVCCDGICQLTGSNILWAIFLLCPMITFFFFFWNGKRFLVWWELCQWLERPQKHLCILLGNLFLLGSTSRDIKLLLFQVLERRPDSFSRLSPNGDLTMLALPFTNNPNHITGYWPSIMNEVLYMHSLNPYNSGT